MSLVLHEPEGTVDYGVPLSGLTGEAQHAFAGTLGRMCCLEVDG